MVLRSISITASVIALAGSALAQSTPSVAPDPNSANPANVAVAPAQTAPDPLTPPEANKPAPLAPEMPAIASPPSAAAAPPVTTPAVPTIDPMLVAIRSAIVGLRPPSNPSDRADLAGLTSYYETPGVPVIWTDASGLNARARKAIAEIRKADDWGLKAAAFDVPVAVAAQTAPDALANAEIKLGLAYLKYARHARGGRIDPQALTRLLDRKPRPYDPSSLMKAISTNDAPDAYLRSLHPKHPQFHQLRAALVEARSAAAALPAQASDPAPNGKRRVTGATASPSADAVQRLVVNMERWRWMPDDLGKFYVWDSVTEQMTTVVRSGQVVFSEKIVVGKPSTPTPSFSADMQFVIFHPEWGVPDGIKSNELAPLLRRASNDSGWFFGGGGRTPSSVLQGVGGLRVMSNGQPVNPDQINWSSVDIRRFQFIQPAGARNVLGIVKFRFPNKHDVYMHDTPERHLFNTSVRAFSHGCMRVQNPVRLAEVILDYDKGWSPEKVRGYVSHGGEIKLEKSVPVHIAYFTAIPDADGKIQTKHDLYGLDGRIASALEGRAVNVASAAAPVEKGERTDRSDRKDRPRRNQSASAANAGPSGNNPFAGLFGN